jgi:NAD(P)-dependent dehydrogenase (short-subunit alcohol dehydrogenase family)
VVITGGASGIGLGAATAFLERGAAVELWDLRAEDLERARAPLAPVHGDRIVTERVDVSDAPAVERAAERAEARGPVAVLLNSAGISAHRRPAVDIAQADWERMLAVNLTGPFLVTQAAAPLMRDSGGGAIVNIT